MRGDWEPSTAYAPYDVVMWNGSAFVGIDLTAGPGQPPPDADGQHWKVLAQRGSDGAPGAPGLQGSPGEVTNAALNAALGAAIAGMSANTNGIATLATPFADPDMEAIRLKLNELILNGRR